MRPEQSYPQFSRTLLDQAAVAFTAKGIYLVPHVRTGHYI